MTIRLIVIRDGARARALLAAVGRRLQAGDLVPDARGDVFVVLDASPDGDPWQRLRAALDGAGDDWWEHLHLPSRAVAARMSGAERR